MTKSLIYLLLLSLFALSACSGSEDFDIDTAQPSRELLMLRVSANNFTTVGGAPSTRAADNGNATTFENGDRVGVIILDGSGNLLANNIPYICYGKKNWWAFDTTNDEGKSVYYYDNGLNNLTYIVYYPYSSEANGITSIANLKAKFAPKADQRNEEDYRASDLMVWSVTQSPLKTLSAELKHAYACVSLLPQIKVTLATGQEFNYVPTKFSDVSCTTNGKLFLAYQLGDGHFRCILPADYSCEVRCFLTPYDKTYDYTHSLSSAAVANMCYTFTLKANIGTYVFAQAQIGDYYCKASDGAGYLIPRDIVLSEEQRATCLGIVLKGGRDASGEWKDDCTYYQKDGITEMTTVHGYVLALYAANSGNDCAWGPYGAVVGTNTEMTGFYGYKNTNTIKAYAIANSKTLQVYFPATYHATVGYEETYPAPANSSGWFSPSIGQVLYWYTNRFDILASVRKATGKSDYTWDSYYWSSSEYVNDPAGNAWDVRFGYGNESSLNKSNSRDVRGVFAF